MNSFWKFQPGIIPELELVRGLILLSIEQARLPGDQLETRARALFDPPGKMIRPGMLLLSSRLLGGPALNAAKGRVPRDWRPGKFLSQLSSKFRRLDDIGQADLNSIPVEGGLPFRFYLLAAAVELLHTATLLHDDVLDSARTRRNQNTLSHDLGNRNAILLGDQFLTMAFELISESASINSGRLISRVVSGICRGEILQSSMLFNVQQGSSLRRYRQRIAGKTAAMFSLSLYLGAREMENYLSNPEEQHPLQLRNPSADDPRLDSPASRHLRRFGYVTGMAFQIIDDVLDLDVSTASGKEKGKDLKEGIITLPIIRMLEKGELQHNSLQRLWASPIEISSFLCDENLRSACVLARNEALEYAQRAESELLRVEQHLHTEASVLRDLSERLISRST